MRMDVKIEGLGAAERGINRALGRIRGAVGEALVETGLDLWGKSNRIAPKDTGDLRASAYLATDGHKAASGNEPPAGVSAPGGSKAVTVVEVGYGVPYALKVHEMPEYRNPTTPGTRPKFLESTLVENSERYIRHIAKRAKEAADRP